MTESEAIQYRDKLSERLGSEWVERFDQLRQYLTFGETYHRGITDCWSTAVRMACEGRDSERDYWMGHLSWLVESAEKARAHKADCSC
jgi:hypothetical protein